MADTKSRKERKRAERLGVAFCHLDKRGTWGTVKPVERVKGDGKKYNSKRDRSYQYEDDSASFLFFFVFSPQKNPKYS